MRDLSPVSERSSFDSTLKPKPLNFSRPRPSTQRTLTRDSAESRSESSVRAVAAFYEPHRALPQEPRFSEDSERVGTPNSGTSTHSAASEFAWDGRVGELVSRRRADGDGRNAGLAAPSNLRPSTSTSHGSGGSTAVASPSEDPLLTSSSSSAAAPPPIPSKHPKIVRRVSVEQESERVSLASSRGGEWDEAGSHHTVSVDGGAQGSSGRALQEIHKLQKKGINPALYAEMKAARKGKGKWIGPLVGNTYIG